MVLLGVGIGLFCRADGDFSSDLNKLDFEDNGGISAEDLEKWLKTNGL